MRDSVPPPAAAPPRSRGRRAASAPGFAPLSAGFQDAASLPSDPVPYGPSTWGPTQWLAVAAYVLAFLAVLWLISRLASPRVPSESDADNPQTPGR